jgi:hypothetical protein
MSEGSETPKQERLFPVRPLKKVAQLPTRKTGIEAAFLRKNLRAEPVCCQRAYFALAAVTSA